MKKEFKVIADLLPKNVRVLDVGCGDGSLMSLLIKEKNIEAFLNLDIEGSKVLVGDGPQLKQLKKNYPNAIFVGKLKGKELAKYNIAVNAITPAGAKTKILDQMSKEHVQWMLSKVPRGRFLEINELSSMVCWLSSEENSFSTGAVFDISGGRATY